jgi:HNH endonuclease
MAVIGEVVRAKDVGIKSTHPAIWLACEGCGAERWVLLDKGQPRSRKCKPCSGRANGRLKQCSEDAVCEFCVRPFERVRLNQRFCSRDCQHACWVKEHIDRRRAVARGWVYRNKEKLSVYGKEYRRVNRERLIAKTQTRRTRKKGNGGSFTVQQWNELCAKYGYRCLACKKTGVKLSVDHVIPVAFGGSSDISNIQPLCLPCNMSKGVQVIDYREQAAA